MSSVLFYLIAPALAQSVDGFDYPVDSSGYATESNDGDGYYNALDWTDSSGGYYGHCGEDWNGEGGGNSDYGDSVYASADGWVTAADHYGSGWGNIITIEHEIVGAGTADYEVVQTMYAHLSVMDVSVGDWVSRGDKIGEIGDADGAYYAHLHFEFRWDESMSPTESGGYGCYSESSGTAEPSVFIDGHRTWSGGSSPGDTDYCSTSSLCGEGEGDCDDDSECESGLTCVMNVGADYGWGASIDVCESSGPVPGDLDYCSTSSRCGEGEGDCDSDGECESGLSCVMNVGASYGWGSTIDVCEASGPVPGDTDYCSTSHRCRRGEGDCDSNAECRRGLTCVQNVGADYGWGSSIDVCE